ncbi:MAG: 23S rRNA (pseudouridine(1915)-N(3))-methyltransferase RlmH [Oscillospiraceae bacterium]|jgi:23S rRNA (pseudouridine1915-N3)-methyltransferase|nr:23S rRNA (pseudouridine(1915)-N(3))-methyltransferase RlmH [Oscillospiraceae bacterium]
MLRVTIICLGKLKEPCWRQAAEEYAKRLGAYCKLEVAALPPAPLPENPSPAQVRQALALEAKAVFARAAKGACAALCVEGQHLSSEQFGAWLDQQAGRQGAVNFFVGSSYGLDESLKARADLRLSLSAMTFPHQLARVMLLEQIYRAFNLMGGGKYHK